eukprot:570832-Hanusia_phi.AAC.1
MSNSLLWKDLDLASTEHYVSLKDPQSRWNWLKDKFSKDLGDDEDRVKILVDLFYYTLQFGIDKSFTYDKLSALLSIIKQSHEDSMRRFLPAATSFENFKNLLIRHCVNRPPYSVGLFTMQDSAMITDFVSKGYYRHYMLYKYAFTKKTELSFSTYYTYTKNVIDDLPAGFLQPLKLAQGEDEKLRKSEEEATAKNELNPEDLEKAGVPADIREEVLKQVNEKMNDMKTKMEEKLESQTKELQARISELEKARAGRN